MSGAGKDAVRIDIVSCRMKYRRFALPGKPGVGMSKGTLDWMTCSFTAFQQYFSHGRMIINYLCSETMFIVEKGCRIRLSNGLAVSFTGNHSPVQHFDLI